MYKIRSIVANNILCFESTEAQLLCSGPLLVIGSNQDTTGSISNGSGKTSAMELIAFALFNDKGIKGDLAELRYTGAVPKAITEVKLTLVDQSTDDTIEIHRTLKDLKVTCNSFEQLQGATKSQIAEELYKRLGLIPNSAHKFFLSTAYLNKEAIDKFASKNSTSSERLEVIGKLLELSKFDKASKICSTESNRLSGLMQGYQVTLDNYMDSVKSYDENVLLSQVDAYNKDINRISDIIVTNQKQIEEINNSFVINSNKQKEINSVTVKLNTTRNEFDSVADKLDNVIPSLNEDIANIISQISEYFYSEEEISMYKSLVSELTQKHSLIQTELSNIQANLRSIEALANKELYCPDCNAKLFLVSNKLEKSSKDYTSEIKELKDKYADLLEDKEAVSLELDSANKVVTASTYILKELDSLNSQWKVKKAKLKEFDGLENKLEELTILGKSLKSQLTTLEQELSILCNGDVENYQSTTAVKIRELNNSNSDYNNKKSNIVKLRLGVEQEITNARQNIVKANEIKTKIEEFSDSYEANKFWAIGYKQARTLIVQQFAPMFSELTNKFLSKFGFNVSVEFVVDLDKNKFDVNITDEFGFTRDFGTYSQGECTRVSLAILMALQQIMRDRGVTPFNFCIFDEVMDGLDGIGADKFIDILMESDMQSIVISHNDIIKEQIPNVLLVTRKNGKSTMERL